MTLTAKVISKPACKVVWYRDEVEIKPTFKIKMTHVSDVVTLLINGATQKMSGVYKCVATNPAGSTDHKATVTVSEKMEPPKFVTKLLNKDVKEGLKATLTCSVKGKPLPEVTW